MVQVVTWAMMQSNSAMASSEHPFGVVVVDHRAEIGRGDAPFLRFGKNPSGVFVDELPGIGEKSERYERSLHF